MKASTNEIFFSKIATYWQQYKIYYCNGANYVKY